MKVLSFNVFRGYHTQFLNEYNWRNRRDGIIDFIKKINPDILLLQECNKLKYSEDIENFMINFTEYNYDIHYSSSDIKARSQLIAYSKDTYISLETGKKWLSDTPDKESKWSTDEFGRIITYNKLYNKKTGNIVWVFNVHFDINIENIMKSIHLVPKIINKLVKENEMVIVGGDFNIDIDELNMEMEKYNFTTEMNIKTQDNEEILFTFIGKRFYEKKDKNVILQPC